jgi:HEAT repeat protein
VRRAALRILSYLGPDPALGVLQAATRDPDERTRDVAIAGLALLESPDAVTTLLELAFDASPQTRAVALRALGAAGSSEPRVVERLSVALRDADAWARYYACQSIGKLRLEPLGAEVGRLLTDAAGQVRVAAIEALSHLRSEEAFAALVVAAGSEELDLTRAALIGLGLSGRREALGLLLSHADSKDAATRLITLSALSNLDAPEVLPALARGVRDPDESVRMAAVGFLGTRSGSESTGVLAGLLKDPTLHERVLEALSAPRDPAPAASSRPPRDPPAHRRRAGSAAGRPGTGSARTPRA